MEIKTINIVADPHIIKRPRSRRRTIDAAAEAISVGLATEGDTMCMYGSTIFMISLTKKQSSDPRLWYAPWLFKGEHASMAGLSTSGTLTHWFRDQFGKDLDLESGFSKLTSEASARVSLKPSP